MSHAVPIASVVIPAHNEAATIGRNLSSLYDGVVRDEIEVLVVCNGCTDETAVRARQAADGVQVLEIAQPSKAAAMRLGNDSSDIFPRVHLDADVVLLGEDLKRLVEPLQSGTVLAAAPTRVLATGHSSTVVRWYYDVWERLPRVTAGLFGRGAIALSEQGQARVDALPQLLADDLAVSDAFADGETVIVEDARVHVVAPRRVADLVRRRVRVMTSIAQAEAAGALREEHSTSWRDLRSLLVDEPRLAPKIAVFLAVSAVSRLVAQRAIRRGDFTTWLRDESSRE